MTNYQDFCKKCIQGKIGFKPDFYIIEKIPKDNTDIPKENVDVTIVSPTEAAVDQAKSELKQENDINRNEKKSYLQSGGKSQIKDIKSRKKQYKVKGTVKSLKKKGKEKKKGENKKKNNLTYKSLWM